MDDFTRGALVLCFMEPSKTLPTYVPDSWANWISAYWQPARILVNKWYLIEYFISLHQKIFELVDFLTAMEEKIQKYGSSWMGWFGPLPVYFVSNPDLIRDVLNSPHAINKSRTAYSVLEELLGDGILILDGTLNL